MTADEQAAYDAWASAGEERDERDERPTPRGTMRVTIAHPGCAAFRADLPDLLTSSLRWLAGHPLHVTEGPLDVRITGLSRCEDDDADYEAADIVRAHVDDHATAWRDAAGPTCHGEE